MDRNMTGPDILLLKNAIMDENTTGPTIKSGSATLSELATECACTTIFLKF
jgi:hypothetical protein